MKRLLSIGSVALVIVLALTVGASLGMPIHPTGLQDSAFAQIAVTPTSTPIPTGDGPVVEDLEPFDAGASPSHFPKLDSTLVLTVEQVESGHFSAQSAAAEFPLNVDESVGVTVHIQEGYIETVSEFLTSAGASVRNTGADYIEAYVPVSLLPSASEQEGVISIRTIIPSSPTQGTSVSGAATAHGAPAWHSAGFRGQNEKIGIIDVGFESIRRLGSAELPSTIRARCYTEIGTFTSSIASCETGGDHGTASTEAAFDIAPGATYFISNPISSSDLQQTVRWMVSEGVDVINYSLSDLWEGPGDGTSPFSWSSLKSVDIAVGSGLSWTNAVGNGAKQSWFGSFVDVQGDGLHNFEGADQCNTFSETLSAGERLTAQLRWEGAWGGARADLDLYLYRSTGGSQATVVHSSRGAQTGGVTHYPREEILSFTIPVTGSYCLAVKHESGPTPSWFQMQAFTGQELEHNTPHGSVRSPAESANAGMLAVGAAPWNNNSVIEEFSGRGPTPDGRIKPDIVGSDGAFSNTYRGNWFGTSQASPHLAGLAALVRQRFPAYNPQQIASYIESNASARGATPNNTWGYGFAQLPSLGSPQPAPNPSPVPSPSPTTSCFTALTGTATEQGTWTSNCVSVEPARARSGNNYARFYTFAITNTADVTITLTSDEDTYLNLREGTGRDGRIVDFDDDIAPGSNTNSRIELAGEDALAAGNYTIEATTYYPETTGSFTLSVVISGSSVQPSPTPSPTPPIIPSPQPTPPATPSPLPTPSEPAAGFIDVSRGYDHACALHSNGSITCWGRNDVGQATPPTSGRFVAISSDYKGTCAVRDDGAVLCWGSVVGNP